VKPERSLGGPQSAAGKIEVQSLADAVSSRLYEMIINGELRPGDRLLETALCELLGVSRSPVREALRRLEADGMVEILPRRGAVIARLSMSEARDIYACRQLVLSELVGLAAATIGEHDIARLTAVLDSMRACAEERDLVQYLEHVASFNEIVARNAGNAVMAEIAVSLWWRALRYRVVAIGNRAQLMSSFELHREIAAALAAHDVELARSLTVRLISESMAEIAHAVERDPQLLEGRAAG